MKKLIIAAVVMMAMCACTMSVEEKPYRTIQVFDYSGNLFKEYKGRNLFFTDNDFIRFCDEDGKRVFVSGGIIIIK